MFDDGAEPSPHHDELNCEVLRFEEAVSKECVTAGYQVIARSHLTKIYSDLPTNGEDWDFVFRLHNIERAVMIRTPVTYLYRRRSASLSTTKGNALSGAVTVYGRQQQGFYPGAAALQQARSRRARHEIFVHMRPVLWQAKIGLLFKALASGLLAARGRERLKFLAGFLFHLLAYAINDPLKRIGVLQHLRITMKNFASRFYQRDRRINLLVMQVNHFGDSVCFLPTLDALRRLLPTAHISLVTSHYGAQLVKESNLVDEVISFPSNDYKRLYRSPLKLLRVLAKLWVRPYNAALADPNDPSMSGILSFLVGAPVRIGFNTAAKGRFFFTKRLHFNESRHVIENAHSLVAELVATLGIKKPVPYVRRTPVIFTTSEAALYADKFSELLGKDLVLLHPFSKFTHKEWPIERFSALASRIKDYMPGTNIAVATDSHPFPSAEGVSILDSITIRELAWLLAKTSVFVGNNSGPKNLAIAMGTPTICLTGSAASYWWPYHFEGSTSVNIMAKIGCSPCENLVVHQRCVRGLARPECMEAISVETVLAEVIRMSNSQPHHGKAI